MTEVREVVVAAHRWNHYPARREKVIEAARAEIGVAAGPDRFHERQPDQGPAAKPLSARVLWWQKPVSSRQGRARDSNYNFAQTLQRSATFNRAVLDVPLMRRRRGRKACCCSEGRRPDRSSQRPGMIVTKDVWPTKAVNPRSKKRALVRTGWQGRRTKELSAFPGKENLRTAQDRLCRPKNSLHSASAPPAFAARDSRKNPLNFVQQNFSAAVGPNDRRTERAC